MIVGAITVSTTVIVFICGIALSVLISLGAWVLSKVASLGETSAKTGVVLAESIKTLGRVNSDLDETSKQVADLSTVVARIDERTFDHDRRIEHLESHPHIKDSR